MLWNDWWLLVCDLRSACARTRSFLWRCVCLAGFSTRKVFATCFYGILNTCTGALRYSSAGHNPPYRIGSGGTITPLDAKGGTPLGMLARKEYQGASAQLDPGDGLFLYCGSRKSRFG
jgi:serine phosphatase RsbU (regulator of sigma subunit)